MRKSCSMNGKGMMHGKEMKAEQKSEKKENAAEMKMLKKIASSTAAKKKR